MKEAITCCRCQNQCEVEVLIEDGEFYCTKGKLCEKGKEFAQGALKYRTGKDLLYKKED